jgi:hypothetical protein
MIVLDFIATLTATLIGVYFAYRWGVSHERQKKKEDEEESQRRLLTAIRKELETNLDLLNQFDKGGLAIGNQMFLWTDAYQTGVSARRPNAIESATSNEIRPRVSLLQATPDVWPKTN